MGRWVRGSGRLASLVGAAVLSLASASSSYQSARTMAPGTIEGGAAGTFIGLNGDGPLPMVEVLFRGGLGKRSEAGFKMTLVAVPGLPPAGAIRCDWKIALVRDHVALDLPVGLLAAGSGAMPYTDPTLLVGTTLGPYVEIDGGVKVLLNGEAYAPGAHLGVRLSSDLEAWALHPEIGAVVDPEGGVVVHAGLAIIGRMGTSPRARNIPQR